MYFILIVVIYEVYKEIISSFHDEASCFSHLIFSVACIKIDGAFLNRGLFWKYVTNSINNFNTSLKYFVA